MTTTSLKRYFLIAALAALSACSSRGEAPAPVGAPSGEPTPDVPGQVRLSPEGQERIGLKVAPAAERSLPVVLSIPGRIVVDPDRVAHVSPRLAGQVIRVYKRAGDRVAAGDVLAEIKSADLARVQNDYLQVAARARLAAAAVERQRRLGQANVASARAALALARVNWDRQRQLWAGKIAARKDVLEAESAAAQAELEVQRQQSVAQQDLGEAEGQRYAARVDLERAASELRAMGAVLPAGGDVAGVLVLRAPIAGAVVERDLTLGKRTEPQDVAFKIYDTSTVWVEADVPENDLGAIRAGQPATVTVATLAGRRFQGRIASVAEVLDPRTRTAKARVALANPGRVLRPEMFATVTVAAGGRRVLAVPEAAVQTIDQRRIVFVATGPDTFQERDVQLGTETGEYYPVRAGLKPGERVVVAGSLRLKAEANKAAIAEGAE